MTFGASPVASPDASPYAGTLLPAGTPEAVSQASTSKRRTAGRGVTGANCGPTSLVFSHANSHERVKSHGSRDAPASHSICARKLKGASPSSCAASGPATMLGSSTMRSRYKPAGRLASSASSFAGYSDSDVRGGGRPLSSYELGPGSDHAPGLSGSGRSRPDASQYSS